MGVGGRLRQAGSGKGGKPTKAPCSLILPFLLPKIISYDFST